jgi:hypothetical protein
MKKPITAFLLILSMLTFSPITPAQAEECPKVDLATYGLKVLNTWTSTKPVRVITWASNAKNLFSDPVTQPFTTTEEQWLIEAINGLGAVLEHIAFLKVDTASSPVLQIGFTALSKGTVATSATSGGQWGLWKAEPGLNKAEIQLLDSAHRFAGSTAFTTKEDFIHRIQNEVGNMLGVSDYDVKNLGPGKNLTIFDTSKFGGYGRLTLSDLDTSILRTAYGESTCPSSYSDSARALNLIADQQEGEKYLASLAPTATATPTTSASKKSTTITCIKGSSTKKVTAVSPKCPSGYKKK